jgi:uncharacterized protein
MKNLTLFILGVALGAGGMYLGLNYRMYFRKNIVSPVVNRPKPLDKYTIENLGKRGYGTTIILDEPQPVTKNNEDYIIYKFHFITDDKKVSGLAHIPNKCTEEKRCPVLVQIRGYADPEGYYSGYGTYKSAEKYADAGFISLAPDFLGYGGSASPSANVYEARFETYTTALNLLAGVASLPMGDASKIGIWGHSNGGQIALTVLEISQKSYPTVLWAPVSAPFPYSVLYYTDDELDHGREARKTLAGFEEDYDTEQYALVNYLDRIYAPIQLHQGTADASVPVKWSDNLAKNLKVKGKDITYNIYPGADHNMLPNAWEKVVARDVEFLNKKWSEKD